MPKSPCERTNRLVALGLVSLWLGAGPASAEPSRTECDRTVSVSSRVSRALGQLGEVVFFTSPGRPLRGLDLRQPAREIASPHLGIARSLLTVLRAAEAPIDPGATELFTLTAPRHLRRLFSGARVPSLLIIEPTAYPDEVAALDEARAERLCFVAAESGAILPAARRTSAASKPGVGAQGARAAKTPAPADDTSFGRLTSIARKPTARHRATDLGVVKVQPRAAGPGKEWLILSIDRDFGRGLGTVSFLYGSGVIVTPDWSGLVVEAEIGTAAQKVRPGAVFDEGLTLELGYEIPRGARRLALVDGDVRLPLTTSTATAN